MDQTAILGVLGLIITAYSAIQTRQQTNMLRAQIAGAPESANPGAKTAVRFWKTPGLYAVFLLALLAWVPTIINLYAKNQPAQLVSYGLAGRPLSFSGKLQTASLLQYSDKDRIMLVVRLSYSNIDRMRDHAIEKSITYTMDGPIKEMVVIGQTSPAKLRIDWNEPTVTIEYNAVLLPNQVAPDDIISLSDIARLGGRIVDVREQSVPLVTLGVRPAQQPIPPALMTNCPTGN